MRNYDIGTAADLAALRQGSLRTVLICSGLVLYIWCLILLQPIDLYLKDSLGPVIWGPVFLAIGLGAALAVQKYNLALAGTATLLGICGTVLFNMWLVDIKLSPYMLAVAVSVAGVLFGIRTVVGMALFSSVAILFIGVYRWGYSVVAVELLSPVSVVCAVGMLASLGVSNLYTALHWALDRAMAAQTNEEEARTHRGELARTLKALTEAYQRLEYANYDLARAREVAEAATLNKQRFVAIVSHEMRTPLNVLMALSEIMYFSPERYGDLPLPPELRRDVREMYRSSKHLLRLIDDVLDLAQIEAGRMRVEFNQVVLRDVIVESLDMVQPFVREKGIALEVDLPENLPLVMIDRNRVQQVLLNLLNNAQRYTDHGSIIVGAVHEGAFVRVTVSDTGIGIPPEEHEAMFKEFYQVEGLVAKGHGGAGLGLAICKRFIEMHGGCIWVESEGRPGYGSRFHFTLPVNAADVYTQGDAAPVRAVPVRAPTGRGRTLLLWDHDPAVRRLLERNLEDYRILAFEQITEVPRLIDEVHPQAVVVNSADRDLARQALPALREALSHRQVPVIVCPLVGKRRLASSLGALDYLTKPITREALMGVLGRLTGHAHRVLVVDDDPQMARLISRMLETSGREYEVAYAATGLAALQVMRAQPPDLLLLDLVMPEMTGHEMLAHLKSDAELRDTPVVIVTAQEHTPEEERRLNNGDLRMCAEGGFTNAEVMAYLGSLLGAMVV